MNIIGNIGLSELIVILLLALLVFGPERLPEVSQKVGTLVRDLRKMYTNLSRDLGPELSSLPSTIQEVRDTAEALKALPRDAIRSLSEAAALNESLSPTAPAAGVPPAASSANAAGKSMGTTAAQEAGEAAESGMRPADDGHAPGFGQIDPRTAPVQEAPVDAAALRAEGPGV